MLTPCIRATLILTEGFDKMPCCGGSRKKIRNLYKKLPKNRFKKVVLLHNGLVWLKVKYIKEHVPYCLLKIFTYFWFCAWSSTIFSTTEGSANVVISPKSFLSPTATFRNIRLIILPDLVLGNPGTIYNVNKNIAIFFPGLFFIFFSHLCSFVVASRLGLGFSIDGVWGLLGALGLELLIQT